MSESVVSERLGAKAHDFVEPQKQFRRASEDALVPTVLVNTDDQDLAHCARTILEGLE